MTSSIASPAPSPSGFTPPTVAQPSAATPTVEWNQAAIDETCRKMTSPFLMRAFLGAKLPLALVAGLRVDHLDRSSCQVSVPYGWRSQNPFRSTYFAAQAMAAEMSTGALGMMAVRAAPASIAMLIINLEASFGKKANRRATFTCEQGDELFAAVARTLADGEAATARVETVGRMDDGTEVSRFAFTWSFKKRSR